MQFIEVLAAIGKGAKFLGCTIGRQFKKVNPDVYRELAFVSMSSYSLVLPKREKVVDRGSDGFLPVVLVHGLGGNRGAWWPLRLFLRLQGHRRLYAFGYEDGTVEELAQRLKSFVEEVRQVTGVAQVDIVAHSLGGLIVRYAIQRLDMAHSVRTFVSMATPHLGTYAAQYANTPLTLAIRPDSRILCDLNRDDMKNYPIRFVTIFSNRDVYIVPNEMMMHPHAENIFVPNVSHSQHLVSPPVFRKVAQCLQD